MVSQMWPPDEVLLVLPPGAGVGGKLARPRGIHRGVAERACMHAARREPVGVQCSALRGVLLRSRPRACRGAV